MKVRYQGREVEATSVNFLTLVEDFNEYRLSGGGIIKLKTVVTQIVRLEGETTPEGQPVYHVKSTNIVRLME